jgi:hypothetical protein
LSAAMRHEPISETLWNLCGKLNSGRKGTYHPAIIVIFLRVYFSCLASPNVENISQLIR